MGRRVVIVLCGLALLGGCGAIRPDRGNGAASVSAAQGTGEGPIGEVPTNGAFGPDMLSP